MLLERGKVETDLNPDLKSDLNISKLDNIRNSNMLIKPSIDDIILNSNGATPDSKKHNIDIEPIIQDIKIS